MSATRTYISAAGNTLPSALAVLVSLGYAVSISGADAFKAERADCVLVADDLLALLGLATLFERRGESWLPSDDEVADFLSLDAQLPGALESGSS